MKLSFILLCYNEQTEIVKSINSIRYSNIPAEDYEIIVVDDGSTDGSVTAVKDLGVVVYRTSEDGANMSSRGLGRNIGISNCKGEYVIFLDGSDYYDSKMLNKAYYEFLDNYGYDIYSNAYYFQEQNLDEYTVKQNIVNMICRDNPMSYIIKKSYLINNNLLFDEGRYSHYHEDTYFAMRAYDKTNSIYRIKTKQFIIHHKVFKKSFYFCKEYMEIFPDMIDDLRKVVKKKYILDKIDMEESLYIRHYMNYLKYKIGKEADFIYV